MRLFKLAPLLSVILAAGGVAAHSTADGDTETARIGSPISVEQGDSIDKLIERLGVYFAVQKQLEALCGSPEPAPAGTSAAARRKAAIKDGQSREAIWPGQPSKAAQAKANAARANVRGHVEHAFAHQKAGMGLFVRTSGLARARTKIGLANLAYNFRRLAWLNRQSVPA